MRLPLFLQVCASYYTFVTIACVFRFRVLFACLFAFILGAFVCICQCMLQGCVSYCTCVDCRFGLRSRVLCLCVCLYACFGSDCVWVCVCMLQGCVPYRTCAYNPGVFCFRVFLFCVLCLHACFAGDRVCVCLCLFRGLRFLLHVCVECRCASFS